MLMETENRYRAIRRRLLRVIAAGCTALIGLLPCVASRATSAPGELHGITRDSQGLPLADAQILLHSLEASTDRTAVSGADGSFSVADLNPGRYELTASKEGFEGSQPSTLEVAAGQSLNHDVTLGPTRPATSASPAVKTEQAPSRNFFGRLAKAYGANGAICASATVLTCYAPEWAIVNYVEKQLTPKDYLTFRNEYFDDIRGQRTGFKSRYTEHLVGWGRWIGTTILFRPEVRFERSYDAPAYDDGNKKNQLTLAGDIIWFF